MKTGIAHDLGNGDVGRDMSQSGQRLRFGRIVAFGLLAELATILLIVLTLLIHSRVFAAGQPQAVVDAFAQRLGAILGPVAGGVFTFGAAMLCTRPLEGRFRTHGVLVGVVAALLTVPGLMSAAASQRPLYLAATLLKLLAGLAGGALSERRAATSKRSTPEVAGE